MRTPSWQTTTLVAAAFLLGTIAAGSGSLGAAWEPIARVIGLDDQLRPASANVLSEHEIEDLDQMPAQSQAELLLERSINHYRGANDEIIAGSIRDENENIRYWAVEGLAYLAVDASIEPLLDVFHNDPSPLIRERAACGLAQSGMFSAAQRRTAVPRLLDYAEDGTLDDQTREWVFQALRDITGESLPHEPAAWRAWYSASRKG